MTTEATNTEQELLSDLAIPPGETVLEGMEHHGISTQSLAERINLARHCTEINRFCKS